MGRKAKQKSSGKERKVISAEQEDSGMFSENSNSTSAGLIRCKPLSLLMAGGADRSIDNKVQSAVDGENATPDPFCELPGSVSVPAPSPTDDCPDDVLSISTDCEAPTRPKTPKKRPAEPVKLDTSQTVDLLKVQSAFVSPPKMMKRKFQKLKGNYRKVTDFFSAAPTKPNTSTVPSMKENTPPKHICLEAKPSSSADVEVVQSPIQPYTNFDLRRKLCRSTHLRQESHGKATSASYIKTYKSSLFPVMISGDFDVDMLVCLLKDQIEDNESKLHIKVEPDKNAILIESTIVLELEPERQIVESIRRTLQQVEGFSMVEQRPPPQMDLDVISISSSLSDEEGNAAEIWQPKEESKKDAKGAPKTTKVAAKPKPRAIKKSRQKPVCPFYKIVKGTTFAVDAFKFGSIDGVSHYFLTHFHMDHYVGLNKNFAHPIYMSNLTARLAKKLLKIDDRYIHTLGLNAPEMIGDVEVTALDANHCPGAVMFVFKLPSGECILHVGDFRAHSDMETEPIFWNNHISCIYLDTTYLTYKYEHPTQMESIDRMLQLVKEYREQNIGVKYVIIVGTYLIGKEKVWSSLARYLGCRVWLERSRQEAVECYENSSLLELIDVDPTKALIHVLPLQNVFYDNLVSYLKQFDGTYNHVLAIRPSGWEKNRKPQRRGPITIYGIQYSEHSSYSELERFVRYLQPEEAISTVPYGKDLNKVPSIPAAWLSQDAKPQKKGQQSITNFMKVKRSATTISKEEDQLLALLAAQEESADDINLTAASMQVEINQTVESDWTD